jgi:hypothetical protein
MNKGTRLIKRVVALFLVLLLSIESFAAIVSDNDGSAFITKAEFDWLKNDFKSQIDQYNTSIDSKIDGAISAYLAGLQLSKVSNLTNYVSLMAEQNIYSIAFADKSVPLTTSNNNDFTCGGWWLFYVWGWNLRDGNGNGQINIVSGSKASHNLWIRPTESSLDSKKYFIKEVNIDGNKYYGPYNQYYFNVVQQVTAQKLTSVFNRHTIPTSNPTLAALTFDYRALSSSGTTNLGNYDMGTWGSHSNIEGTIILKYVTNDIDRRWGCLNATGSCDNTGINYAVNYDERWNLTEEVTHAGTKFKGGDNWGAQTQSFNPGAGSGGIQSEVAHAPNVTFIYKTPKIITKTNRELCNHIATKLIDKYVPMYGGLPVTTLPGNGKIKFKYRYVTKKISDSSTVSDTATLVFKTKQFSNGEIEAETEKVYKTTEGNNEWTTCEFEISDAKNDGSTILYVKLKPNNADNYVRFEIDGDIIFTQ